MYTNKCTKCGKEFETKNPKRIICPSCLYPDKAPLLASDETQTTSEAPKDNYPRSYSAGTGGYKKPYQQNNNRPYNNPRPQGGGYNNNQNGGYNRPYNNNYNNNQGGGYNNNQNGGFRPRPQSPGGFRPNQGGFRPRPAGGGFRPNNNFRKPSRPKQLLVSKEQLLQIEELYRKMLPLPNPDAHEVIGEKIELEPRKVFFGINLIRQKMMLPKISFPKRKLAISPDQLTAIKNLYEPLLPLPPIGCHKFLACQLKMDEWRVHVGIGLVRKQLGLDRWNQEREDAPKEFKKVKE